MKEGGHHGTLPFPESASISLPCSCYPSLFLSHRTPSQPLGSFFPCPVNCLPIGELLGWKKTRPLRLAYLQLISGAYPALWTHSGVVFANTIRQTTRILAVWRRPETAIGFSVQLLWRPATRQTRGVLCLPIKAQVDRQVWFETAISALFGLEAFVCSVAKLVILRITCSNVLILLRNRLPK